MCCIERICIELSLAHVHSQMIIKHFTRATKMVKKFARSIHKHTNSVNLTEKNSVVIRIKQTCDEKKQNSSEVCYVSNQETEFRQCYTLRRCVFQALLDIFIELYANPIYSNAIQSPTSSIF